MHSTVLTLLATFGAIVNAIPVAPQTVLSSIQSGEADVVQLMAYILDNSTAPAQLEFNQISSQLTNIGMYLGQITDASCVDDGPGTGVTSLYSESDVIAALQTLNLDMIELAAGIINSDSSSAVAAWQAASVSLYSCYDYIFPPAAPAGH